MALYVSVHPSASEVQISFFSAPHPLTHSPGCSGKGILGRQEALDDPQNVSLGAFFSGVLQFRPSLRLPLAVVSFQGRA